MTQSIIQDTIRLQLRADTVVVSDTVKVSILISALSISTKSDDDLRAEIHSSLNRVINHAEWSFSGINRQRDVSGFERVTLTATTRVHERENVKLDERAEAASIEGLRLQLQEVDLTVPGPLLEKAEKGLRAELIKKALEELKTYNEITGRVYRLGSVNFQNNGDPVLRKGGNATAYASLLSDAGGGAEDYGISNSQKVSLNAAVTFDVIVAGVIDHDETLSSRARHRIYYGMDEQSILQNEEEWRKEYPSEGSPYNRT